MDTISIDLNGQKTLDDIHKNKRTEFSGVITIMEQSGNIRKEPLKAIYGHGNDSWDEAKKSFNLKVNEETDLFDIEITDDDVVYGYDEKPADFNRGFWINTEYEADEDAIPFEDLTEDNSNPKKEN